MVLELPLFPRQLGTVAGEGRGGRKSEWRRHAVEHGGEWKEESVYGDGVEILTDSRT